MDDLTVLEKINLLIVGISSFNSKMSVPSDMPEHNQYIPGENLKSQEYLEKIKEWTDQQKMILNQKKTKLMVFNFTENYQFGTRLKQDGENLEIVDKAKLLGVVITDDLHWETNTESLVKRANVRMELLRKVASFGTNKEEKRNIYILFIRSVLEQSCVVWHSSLTKENEDDLERVQKSALRIILGKEINNYNDALVEANLDSLKDRREELCYKFAKKCTKSDETKHMFPLRMKEHHMETREEEKYIVQHANTERLKKSSIPYMQKLLNKHEDPKHEQTNPKKECLGEPSSRIM